jgi:hypothetical protein
MSYETLRLFRNILLRSFAVGIVIVLISELITVSGWTIWTGLVGSLLHAKEADLISIVLWFFTIAKLFLLFVVLTPALALHWTLKKEKFGIKLFN